MITFFINYVFSQKRLQGCHIPLQQRACNLFEAVTGCHEADTMSYPNISEVCHIIGRRRVHPYPQTIELISVFQSADQDPIPINLFLLHFLYLSIFVGSYRAGINPAPTVMPAKLRDRTIQAQWICFLHLVLNGRAHEYHGPGH